VSSFSVKYRIFLVFQAKTLLKRDYLCVIIICIFSTSIIFTGIGYV
jgi:hypothetical protein